MKIKKIYKLFILFLFLSFNWIVAQSQWINVEGKSDKEILNIIIKQSTSNQKKYDIKGIENVLKEYDSEGRESNRKFNINEAKYIDAALHYLSISNDASSNRLNSISDLHDVRTSVETQKKLIADADSAIAAEKYEIKRKTDETFEAISSIEFFTVAFSILEEKESGHKKYFPIMEYQIAREASNQQLGSKIINLNLVENGILTKEKVEIKLQGKANLEMETKLLLRLNTSDAVGVVFDQIKYGLVGVSLFEPEKDQKYLKKPRTPKEKRGVKTPILETYVGMKQLDNYIAGKLEAKRYKYDRTKYEDADNIINDIIKELKELDEKAEQENKTSETKIKSLGLDAKKYIDARERAIRSANKSIERNQRILDDIIPEYTAALQDSAKKSKSESIATKDAVFWREASILHKQRERRTKTINASHFSDAYDDDDSGTKIEITREYNNFLKNVNQTIVNEKTTISSGEISEDMTTRKTSAIITAFKVIGVYTGYDKLEKKVKLGTAVALKYGFNFDKTSTLTKLPPPPDLKSKNVASILDDETDTLNDETNSLEDEMDMIRNQAMAAANMPTKTPAKKSPKVTISKKANNIRFTSSPRAEVYIAGQKIGKTPLQYYLDPSSPHGIVLKKKGYQDETDVVSVSAGRMVTKNYNLDKVKVEKVAKKSGGRKWLLYAIVGGGVAYAAMGQKKEGPKTGSLSISISIPN